MRKVGLEHIVYGVATSATSFDLKKLVESQQ